MPFNTPVTNPEKGPKTTCSTSPSNVVGTTILPNATAANNAIVIAPLAPILKIHFFKFCWLSQEVFKTLFSVPKEEGISFSQKYLLLIIFI